MPGGPTFNPRHYHFCFMMNNCIIEVNDMYLNLGLAFVYGPNTNFTGRGKGFNRQNHQRKLCKKLLRKLQIQAPNFSPQERNKRIREAVKHAFQAASEACENSERQHLICCKLSEVSIQIRKQNLLE